MVTMVIPTFDRLAALQDTVPWLLAVRGVDELLFVDDCSTDDTIAWLGTLEDPRVRVIVMPQRSGLCRVRNRGLEEARGDWVVMGEDDCRFPPDYVEVLVAEAHRLGADVISAPWVLLHEGEDLPAALERSRVQAGPSIPLDQVGHIPPEPVRTPFLCALALVHRRVFSRQRYDAGFAGNAWREETDFFLRAERAGFACWLTPRTHSWQVRRWPGGAQLAPWRYELWAIRNNGRFLRRHGRYLHARGIGGRPVATQLAFSAGRLDRLGNRLVRPPAGRLKRRLRRSL